MKSDVRNVAGLSKLLFVVRMSLDRTWFFGREVLAGRLGPLECVVVLWRLLVFLSKMRHNKFVRIDGRTRIGLYIPGHSSPAFDQACRKFATFGAKSPNTTVLISVTSACQFRCEHCYQHLDKGVDSPLEPILDAVRELQDRGAAFFNIEGGDPFLVYDRLRRICETIDERSEIWVNSTGKGMTLERLEELKRSGLTAVMFSLHTHDPATLNRFMGRPDAWKTMVDGVELCHRAGVAVAFNSCLTVEQFADGTFEAVMERAKEFGACMVQLIKPKSAGNWLGTDRSRFGSALLDEIASKVHAFNGSRKHRAYPSISAQIVEESPEVFGCTAGGTDRFYINAKGDVQPCEFLNISFGNLNEEPFSVVYDRMRAVFDRPGTKWLCEAYSSHVSRIMEEKKLDRLPLPKAESAELFRDWDRGPETDLYRRIENR